MCEVPKKYSFSQSVVCFHSNILLRNTVQSRYFKQKAQMDLKSPYHQDVIQKMLFLPEIFLRTVRFLNGSMT